MGTAAKILVTGANGRLGKVLTETLRLRFGHTSVIATDLSLPGLPWSDASFRQLNMLDKTSLLALVQQEGITLVYHLAGMLPADCERYRELGWETNVRALLHVLDAAKLFKLRVFWAGSIAACCPETVYGMSKLAAEHWCRYYHEVFGVDVRSVRFPGIYVPGAAERGGMMDVLNGAVRAAREGKAYAAYLLPDTVLSAMHISDAVRAAMELMDAEGHRLRVRTAYPLKGFTFSPAALQELLRAFYPAFRMSFRPDHRQAAAESWPSVIDDGAARSEWGWKAEKVFPEILFEK